jgi:hypothetical protein
MYTAEKFGSMVSLGIWGGIFARIEFDSTTFLTNAIVGVVLLCAGLLTPVFSLTTVHGRGVEKIASRPSSASPRYGDWQPIVPSRPCYPEGVNPVFSALQIPAVP